MTRSLTILGATGSVGSQALDLVERNPGRWRVEALTAGSDVVRLAAGLGVSRTTVTVAYELLAAEGFVAGRVGAGTVVICDRPAGTRPALGPPSGPAARSRSRRSR